MRSSVRSPRRLRMRPINGWNACRSVRAAQGDSTKLVELGHVQKRRPKTAGAIVYGSVAPIR